MSFTQLARKLFDSCRRTIFQRGSIMSSDTENTNDSASAAGPVDKDDDRATGVIESSLTARLSKSEATDKIKLIVNGGKDLSGNLVTNVLARGNEYAIYEIEDNDINDRIRVLIDGHTDESERAIVNRYNKVKPQFIEAKGLLYRTSNFGKMKNRIAHTLSSALLSDEYANPEEFKTLIESLNREFQTVTFNRILYISPALGLTVIAAWVIYLLMDLRLSDPPHWQILCVIFASTLGGSLSIMTGIGKLSFEEHLSDKYYFMLGCERMFLAGLAGVVAYIGMRSGILFPDMDVSNYWGVMLIVITSGFSEFFIPSLLTNLASKKMKTGGGK